MQKGQGHFPLRKQGGCGALTPVLLLPIPVLAAVHSGQLWASCFGHTVFTPHCPAGKGPLLTEEK